MKSILLSLTLALTFDYAVAYEGQQKVTDLTIKTLELAAEKNPSLISDVNKIQAALLHIPISDPNNSFERSACVSASGGAFYIPGSKRMVLCSIFTGENSFYNPTLVASQALIHELIHAAGHQYGLVNAPKYDDEDQVMRLELRISEAANTNSGFIRGRLFRSYLSIKANEELYDRYFKLPLGSELNNCGKQSCSAEENYFVIKNIFDNSAIKLKASELPENIFVEKVRGVFAPPGGPSFGENGLFAAIRYSDKVKVYIGFTSGLGFAEKVKCLSPQVVSTYEESLDKTPVQLEQASDASWEINGKKFEIRSYKAHLIIKLMGVVGDSRGLYIVVNPTTDSINFEELICKNN